MLIPPPSGCPFPAAANAAQPRMPAAAKLEARLASGLWTGVLQKQSLNARMWNLVNAKEHIVRKGELYKTKEGSRSSLLCRSFLVGHQGIEP